MAERVHVSAADLKAKWFSDDANGMTHDHQTEEVVVHMVDGTEYSCTFAEHHAALAAEEDG